MPHLTDGNDEEHNTSSCVRDFVWTQQSGLVGILSSAVNRGTAQYPANSEGMGMKIH